MSTAVDTPSALLAPAAEPTLSPANGGADALAAVNQQQMFGLDVRTAELASLMAGEQEWFAGPVRRSARTYPHFTPKWSRTEETASSFESRSGRRCWRMKRPDTPLQLGSRVADEFNGAVPAKYSELECDWDTICNAHPAN